MDHDLGAKTNIIPSVFLQPVIPNDASDSWVQGRVRATLHDGAFQQSSPLMFAAELVKMFKGGDFEALMKYSDGSTEHRTLLVRCNHVWINMTKLSWAIHVHVQGWH